MKKMLFVLPLILLGGCSLFQDDEALYDEETGLLVESEFAEDNAPTMTYVAPTPAPSQELFQPAEGQAVLSPDGMTIELPAQKIYIGDVLAQQQVDEYPIPVEEQVIVPAQPMGTLSYSQPVQEQPRERTYEAKPAVITLQNREYPNTYVQCMSTDTGCIQGYEKNGYIRVQNLPQFAGYQEVLAPSDYPQGGRWRNNNNIPRW